MSAANAAELAVLLNNPQACQDFAQKVQQRLPHDDPNSALLAASLLGFIAAIPSMLQAVRQALPLDSSPLRRFLEAYWSQTSDVLSEELHGLLGYLDDAYLLGLALLQLASPEVVLPMQLMDWLKQTERLLPAESALVRQLLAHVQQPVGRPGYAL